MADIAPELWKRIERLIKSGAAANPVMQRLLKAEKKNYEDAHQYAIQSGKNTARALQTVLKQSALPDGIMYFNIAERTVRPALVMMYEDVADFCGTTQELLNAAAGIGIKAIRPELNDSRIRGIVDRMTEAAEFKAIEWIMNAPVVNFAQSVVDDSVFTNAAFHKEAGMSPKITRSSAGKCCTWCDALVGVYDYPVENEDVYRRHDNCNCTTSYDPGTGRRQDVWNKRWS